MARQLLVQVRQRVRQMHSISRQSPNSRTSMKRTFAAIVVISVLAGSAWPQQSDRNSTATASTTSASGESSGQASAIQTEGATCAVTPNTVSFGLLTPEGKY